MQRLKKTYSLHSFLPHFFCLLMLISVWTKISAQEEFIPAPAKLIESFPFNTFTGGVIVLRAQLRNYPDSLNFILDTGSGGISLDSATCDRLKIKAVASDKTIRSISGIRKVKFVYNQTLHIDKLSVDSLDFHVND